MFDTHDAIALLKKDHATVKALFKEFEAYAKKRQPSAEGRALADRILHELTVHTSIEERVFYPLMREALKSAEAQDLLLEALEEHHCAKKSMTELAEMDIANERFNAKMQVLSEMVIHHADEEEKELFPKAQKAVGKDVMADIGAALLKAKESAPRQPVQKEETPASPAATLDSALLEKVRATAVR